MKAILVTDMPKNCAECLLRYDYLYCVVFENMSVDPEKYDELREGYSYTSEYCDYRPPLCPLKPLPQKKKEYEEEINHNDDFYEKGWNDCIDEMLGD